MGARARGALLLLASLAGAAGAGCGRVGFAAGPGDVDAGPPPPDAALDPATVCPTYARRVGFPRWILESAVKASWDQAYAECEGSGGRLMVPTSADVYASLSAAILAAAAGGDPEPQQWLGLTDAALEGTFATPALAPGETAYVEWLPGEPNDAGGKPGEDCVAAYGDGVNDEGCGTPRTYWCECDVGALASAAPRT